MLAVHFHVIVLQEQYGALYAKRVNIVPPSTLLLQ